jgi:hypothetical protein
MGFGSLAKVLEPASFMKEINEDLKKSLRYHGAGCVESLNFER